MPDGEPGYPLADMHVVRRPGSFTWWHEYHDVVPEGARRYLSLEPAANLISGYHISAVPDLLQTEEYAWKILEERHPYATARELGRRLEVRMLRQEILGWEKGPTLWVVIDEYALRRIVGDVRTMRAQLAHLSMLAARPDVIVQVSRVTAGERIARLRFTEDGLSDLIYVETIFGSRYPEAQPDIEYYVEELGKRMIAARKQAATPAIIDRILREI